MPTSGARGQAAETLAGFIYNIKEEEAADIPGGVASVGVNRLAREPRALRAGIRLFEFIR